MSQKVTVFYATKMVSTPLSCELQNAEPWPSTVGADAHTHKWRCPHVRIPCPHSARGRSSIIPRSDLQAHLSTCPFEAFSGFFEMNDARLNSLTSRAERLEEELERMREHMKRMEGNVEALGHMKEKRAMTGDGEKRAECSLVIHRSLSYLAMITPIHKSHQYSLHPHQHELLFTLPLNLPSLLSILV